MLKNKTDNLSFLTNPNEALVAYHELGFHIEENLFTPEECEQFIRVAANLDSAKNQTYRPQMMPHHTNNIYLAAMRKPALVTIMNQLVDGKAVGLQTEFFYCKPGTRGFSLHQDNFFVQAPYGVFASAWVALTDTYAEKGGLIAYPGSHKEGLLPVRKLDLVKDSAQDPNANNEETIVPEKYQPINAVVPKGAVFFIHGHLIHGSNPNTTQEWRYVLLNTYIRQGESFRPGNYAQREEIEL
ncbi:MAG: phytanoyl-CoA dioxygenase family protein [Gammaproteobacteria bacterium]|nr:phytanoyl-CoA dioxygenase family protein [Gammaproteobacteria bacterium]MCW5583862.1 phytanoyl-CoA dioxygenase family protein [Gammaproteobacteria bacterium]